jgi:hypothetical protein
VLLKHTVYNCPIPQVPLDERRIVVDRLAVALRQIIDDDDLMAGTDELLHAHTADIAGAAGNKYVH